MADFTPKEREAIRSCRLEHPEDWGAMLACLEARGAPEVAERVRTCRDRHRDDQAAFLTCVDRGDGRGPAPQPTSATSALASLFGFGVRNPEVAAGATAKGVTEAVENAARYAAGQVPNPLDPLAGIVGALTAPARFFFALMDPDTWIRVGLVLIGGAVVIGGVLLVVSETTGAGDKAKAAASSVVAARTGGAVEVT